MIRRLRVLATLILVLGVASPAWAQSSDEGKTALPAADQTAIRQVIAAQLDAFQHDDGAKAFGYATPTIQQKFGDAQTFMAMVKGGYPAVYRPKSVTFNKLVDTEDGPDEILTVIGPDGAAYTAHYLMQKQPNGSWEINGCYLERSTDQNV